MEYNLSESFNNAGTGKNGFGSWICYNGRTTSDPSALKAMGGKDEVEPADWYGSGDLTKAGLDRNLWTEDPTHGYLANYNEGCKNKDTLIKGGEGPVILDTQFVAPPAKKANATSTVAILRLEGKKVYNGGVFIMDVKQIPYGCASWPAFWLIGGKKGDWPPSDSKLKVSDLAWPDYGEIDIIEQINGDPDNHTTLHTKKGCKTSSKKGGAVTEKENDCNKDRGKVGCSIEMGKGTGGELGGKGGIYACEWKPNEYIKYWFWKRGDKNIPSDIGKDSTKINTSEWGEAHTEHNLKDNCNSDYFKNLHMIINTTICGDWAGNVSPGTDECKWEKKENACQNMMLKKLTSKAMWDNKKGDFQWKINYVKTYENKSENNGTNWSTWVLVAVLVSFAIFFAAMLWQTSSAQRRPSSRRA